MKISDGEKLIIAMLCNFFKDAGTKGEIDSDFVMEAIYSGNLWSIKWEYPGVFNSEESSEETVKEVCDILDMWTFIESACENLTEDEKAELSATEGISFELRSKFEGFDENNESEHLNVAKALIDRLGRWSNFQGRGLNSHFPTLTVHRRGCAAFSKIRDNLAERTMGKDELLEIFRSMKHPQA